MTRSILVAIAALGLAVGAGRVGAYEYLDDPGVTPATSTDYLLLSAATVSSTQSSVAFGSRDATFGVFILNVTACSSCNITLRIEAQDPDGSWYSWCSAAAVTGTGTTRTGIAVSSAVASELTGICNRALPDRFRAQVLWNSGTSASYTVAAVVS